MEEFGVDQKSNHCWSCTWNSFPYFFYFLLPFPAEGYWKLEIQNSSVLPIHPGKTLGLYTKSEWDSKCLGILPKLLTDQNIGEYCFVI